jgi:hypothetical protein
VFLLANFVKDIPPAIWAASIAVLGVSLSLLGQSLASRRQREFELRRDHLLSLAEKAAIPLQMFAKITHTDNTIAEVDALAVSPAGELSKALCVVGLATIEAAFAANKCFVRGWYASVLKERVRVDWIEQQIKANEADRKSLETEIRFVVERRSNEPNAATYVPYIEELGKKRNVLFVKFGELHKRRVGALLTLRIASDQAAAEYGKLLLELQMTIREEIESASRRKSRMRIDRAKCRALASDNGLENAKSVGVLVDWLQNAYARDSSGQDPFLESPAKPPPANSSAEQ